MNEQGPDAGAGVRRKPRKATPKRLENAALHYLARYSSSAENLRRVLMRRVDRSTRQHGTDPEEGTAFVDDLIARYSKAGLLNDTRFAEGQARSLLERGVSPRAIRLRLREKGVSPRAIRLRLREKGVASETVEAVLLDLVEDKGDIEWAAAVALAKRRRIGPFRKSDRQSVREKGLAALARAGFSYDVAQRVVDAENSTDLEGPPFPD